MAVEGNGFYGAVAAHEFAEDVCFLCGTHLTDETATVEHVFPKWLLNEFNLWNVRIQLINGTLIQYKNLVVPCCLGCNNNHLGAVEDAVKSAFSVGFDAIKALDRIVLMQWVLKIFYGLLYREIFLPLERRDHGLGSIVTAEDMEQFQLLHYMLQSVRLPMAFSQMESDIPASIFVFEMQESARTESAFDYKDDILHRTLLLRMGPIGILAAFDMGAQTFEGANYFPRYQEHLLHPVQLAELGANLFAKARVFQRSPKVMFAESNGEVSFNVLPIAGLSLKPVFGELMVEDVAAYLSFFTGLQLETLLPEPGRRITFLTDNSGEFRHIELEVAV